GLGASPDNPSPAATSPQPLRRCLAAGFTRVPRVFPCRPSPAFPLSGNGGVDSCSPPGPPADRPGQPLGRRNCQGTPTMSEKLLTRAEVAQLLSVSLRSVDRLVARGILPAVKVLSTVRFRPEDVKLLTERGAQRS